MVVPGGEEGGGTWGRRGEVVWWRGEWCRGAGREEGGGLRWTGVVVERGGGVVQRGGKGRETRAAPVSRRRRRGNPKNTGHSLLGLQAGAEEQGVLFGGARGGEFLAAAAKDAVEEKHALRRAERRQRSKQALRNAREQADRLDPSANFEVRALMLRNARAVLAENSSWARKYRKQGERRAGAVGYLLRDGKHDNFDWASASAALVREQSSSQGGEQGGGSVSAGAGSKVGTEVEDFTKPIVEKEVEVEKKPRPGGRGDAGEQVEDELVEIHLGHLLGQSSTEESAEELPG